MAKSFKKLYKTYLKKNISDTSLVSKVSITLATKLCKLE
ncbi:hypothetical protein J580_2217 [Acinetobacter sp. 1542444]|nr:hypothetical protein J580_2217 [Acinetobacter sp. 1542444]